MSTTLYLPTTRFHSTLRPESRLPALLDGMNRAKFIRKEADRAGVTEAHLLEFHEVLRCECGKSKCKGWALRWKFGAKRRREAAAS